MKTDALHYPLVGYLCDYWVVDSTGTTYHVKESPDYMAQGETKRSK